MTTANYFHWLPRPFQNQHLIAGDTPGLRVCTWEQVVCWLDTDLWVVEADPGTLTDMGDHMLAPACDLVTKVSTFGGLPLFAADCVEHVLPIYEIAHPGDRRPREAVEAARGFTVKTMGRTYLDAAADAAWFAAKADRWDAAWSVARAAAHTADAARSTGTHETRTQAKAARRAAMYAARATSWAAAPPDHAYDHDPVWKAAYNTERLWQVNRFGELCGLNPNDFAHTERLTSQ